MNIEKYQIEQHNSDFRAAHQKTLILYLQK